MYVRRKRHGWSVISTNSTHENKKSAYAHA
jgi:hypothetical protein